MNTQWKLVPIEPTREMLVAALKTNGACPIYAAMLAAAPEPTTAGEAEVIGYRVRYEQNPEAEYLMYQEPEGLYSSEAIILRSDHRAIGTRLLAERDALQLRLNAADQRIDELTQRHGEHVALVPVERSYDVRAKQILAFNTSKQSGGDLDDALGAAYKAALRYTPHPGEQLSPVSVASRDESISWLKRIDGIGQNRAELIYSMGFRRHPEVPQS